MTLTMSAAAVRAETLVGGSTPHGETGWCLEWSCQVVYGHHGPYRWGGSGAAWAINYFDAAKRWGRVVETSDPTRIPRGAMTFSKGSSKFGHVFIALGDGWCASTDYPTSRKIGRIRMTDLMTGWGHKLLGYIEVTGDGVDLRDKGAIDPMNPGNYYVGAHGDHVLWLGQRLVAHGASRYTPTRDFTKADLKAVAAFQRAQGWSGAAADGLPGAETLRRLKAEPAGASLTPGKVLDLANWKLTLPTGRKGKPNEISQPRLATFEDSHFYPFDGGVVFRTPGNGVTTKGSTNPRTELRELVGRRLAAWDTRHGTHTLKVEASISHLPPGDGGVVIGQIHDADDDRTMIRAINYKGRARLIAEWGRGKGKGGEQVVIGDVSRDTRFTFQIHASAGTVVVSLNGANVTKRNVAASSCFFKCGSYLQAHTDFGEVVLYSVKVTHA